jgi:ATP-binding cassette subfamily B protein
MIKTENSEDISSKLKVAKAQFRYWPRTLGLIWRAAPRLTLAWCLLLVVQGILPAVSVYLTKLVVDRLASAIGAGSNWAIIRPALITVTLTVAVMVLSDLLQSLTDWVRTAQSEFVQDSIKGLVHEKSSSVDVAFYESAEFFDRLDRARSEASGRSLAMLENIGGLVQSAITLVAVGAVLVSYGIWIPLALLISTLPAFFVVLRFDRQYHAWWKRTTPDRRWTQYFDMMLTTSECAAELRLFALSSHFQKSYQQLRSRLRNERLEQIAKQNVSKICAGFAAMVVTAATMAWMIWRAVHGAFSLGDLALFYQAFSRGQGLMRSLLGSAGQVITNSLFLENLFTFLDLKSNVPEAEVPIAVPSRLERGVEFQNVTFSYPGSDTPALNNFSLTVPAGKVIAIVGENGAGKSTLIKLLCRFYDPVRGSILIDGEDIRRYAIEKLWRSISVLFQFQMYYHATANESIALSDLKSEPAFEEIQRAAKSAGAHEFIERLPKGYDTLLGKWFADGVLLSGGEWQRIALARAYLRESQILILDEPTSFMDSWAEADWFARFRDLAKGRTSVIITHRFTIAMRADIIHVMKKGEIVESGSHRALMAQNGVYAQSWKSQIAAADLPEGKSLDLQVKAGEAAVLAFS